MERKINKLEHSHVEVLCTLTEEEWKKAQEAAFKKVASNVQIDGFRKGKAPANLVKAKVDQVKVMNEAIDTLLPKIYKDIIDVDGIKPYAQPKVDVTKLSDKELEVKFTIVVAPDVKLGKYTGFEIGKEDVKVTAEEVENEVKKLLENSGSLVVKEGASEKGDTVIMDFKGTVDGVAFEGGSSENYELVLGSGSFIPGFEDQLIGHKAGEHVDVNVKFPEQYTEELKGKDAVFACDIHEVKAKKLAELNDDFAKDQGIEGVNTVDELKKHLETNKLAEKTRDADSKWFNKLMEEIVKDAKIDIPDEIIDSQFQNRKAEFENRMKQSGLSMEQYLQILGQKQEDLDKQIKENATKEVTSYLVLEAIGEKENLANITDEDIDFEIAKLADQYKMKIEDVKKAIANQIDEFKNNVKMTRIETFIKNNNK